MRIQMLIPLAVLALIVLSPAAHAQTPGVTGADLMNDCRNYPDSKRPRNCELFAGAFAEIARSTDRAGNPRGRLCIGEDVPVAESSP